ncbi:hypothetical protein SEA_BIGGITYBASS_56 [Gordonia phage BiggityBass]|nr:hypothetical protein SEA_BIGGITYBASS_56 [Gordonia phage BiggityBass]
MNRDEMYDALTHLAGSLDDRATGAGVAAKLRELADAADPRESSTKVEYAVRAPNGNLVTEAVPAHPRSTSLVHPSPGQAWKTWDLGSAANVADAYRMAAVNMGMAELADHYEMVQREVITTKLPFTSLPEAGQ